MTMQSWSEETEEPEQQPEFSDYFRAISTNRFILNVQNGRISPWAIYCCDSGIEKMETLTDDQIVLVIRWIDPEFWQRRLKDFAADAALMRHILGQAGL